MLLPWPLTTSTELAQVLRPGGRLRPDSALRTLRENGLPAEPITVVPRTGQGARGRVVWYSSLMVDVARLLRMGEEERAIVHREATRLAGHRAARFVAERLLDAGADPDPAVVDTATGGALTRLAMLTASAREKHLAHLGVETFLGRVADVSGRVAFVVAEDGRTLPIPSPTTSASPWTGALVSVDTELFEGGSTTVWVRPAFDSEADPNERVPGGPHLLTPAERDRLSSSVTSAR